MGSGANGPVFHGKCKILMIRKNSVHRLQTKIIRDCTLCPLLFFKYRIGVICLTLPR